MRVSIRKLDSGYEAWRELCLNAQQIEVTFNGQPCPFLVTADDEKGVVVCFPADDRGKRIHLNRDGSRTVPRRRRRGKVEIKVL